MNNSDLRNPQGERVDIGFSKIIFTRNFCRISKVSSIL